MPMVFISYSHDSDRHKERVLALADRLRREGINCSLDQYEPFPPDGWPRWMAAQIRDADYVLVVCTEDYTRRATGNKEPERGKGAAWEGQLITQNIYDDGGRNTKFIPIIFEKGDARHIPDFLAPATRFNIANPKGYESLYRLLTRQPAVCKPPIGSIRSMPTLGAEATKEPKASDLIDDSHPLFTCSGPTVLWRLPRGFIHLEDLQSKPDPSWATKASFYDYNGEWIGATHYHKSYRRGEEEDFTERQFIKLHIPPSDWRFARNPIHLMMQVRHGEVKISDEGKIEGDASFDAACATVHPPGMVFLPKMPAQYHGLAASGGISDLAAEADNLIRSAKGLLAEEEPWPPEFYEEVKRLRREVRIEVHRSLSEKHPAVINLEEIIQAFSPQASAVMAWLCELRSAILEAAECVRKQIT